VSFHAGHPFGVKLLDAGTAVYLFFIISGFYMAMILNEKYVGAGSNLTFYGNRALRLWPAYAISIALMVAVQLYTGAMAEYGKALAGLPWLSSTLIVASQMTGIGQDLFAHVSFTAEGIRSSQFGADPAHNGMRFLLNYPAWSISVEALFYVIAPFFVRSARGAVGLFAIGVVYCVASTTWLGPTHRMELYFPSSCVFFGLGAISYWLKQAVLAEQYRSTAAIAFALCFVVVTPVQSGYIYLAFALLVPLLFVATRQSRIDGFVGDLSYPVYILHVPVLKVIHEGFGYDPYSLPSLGAVVVVSALVVLLVERPIDRLRQANSGRLVSASPAVSQRRYARTPVTMILRPRSEIAG